MDWFRAALTALLAALAASPDRSAATAPPAKNGKITFDLFDGIQSDIYVMNPDGSGQVNLTNTASH